jgi:hypothetical protein
MEGYGYKKPMEEAEIEEMHCNEGEMDEGMCGPCARCGQSPCQCGPMEEALEEVDSDGDGVEVPKWADQNDQDPKVGAKMDESRLRGMIREAINKALAKRK